MRGRHHRQKPDLSNLVKALEDALHMDDSSIAEMRYTKRWADQPGILMERVG